MYEERKEGTCPNRLSESKCKEIAELEGKKFMKTTDENWPSGCFQYKQQIVYFNRKTEGSNCAKNNVYRCFCKGGELIYKTKSPSVLPLTLELEY